MRSNVGRMSMGLALFLGPMVAQAQLGVESVSPEGIWKTLQVAAVRVGVEPWIKPTVYKYVELDAQVLVDVLKMAPMEFTNQAVAAPVVMTLPMPDGTFSRFEVVESPIMEPALAAKFPEIRTYLGRGIDDRAASVRFDWTPAGFHAQILSPNGAVYIDPLWRGDIVSYASYYKRDYRKGVDEFRCLFSDENPARPLPADEGGVAAVTGETLRTYRTAVAATGEYTAFHGGTVAAGLAAVTTAMNRVSGVYETEVSVRMVLVANNNLIIYTNSGTDPYTNSDGFTMLSQNQTNLNNVIGSANYDIGHVFSTGGGGVANLGVVCGSSKARGVTGLPSPTGDPFYIDYVAHEMGHQFGGNHSFNGTGGSCAGGNRNGSTAYEPGSGSTIMAYAGICGADNLQSFSDPYFHSVSFDEIRIFTQNGSGNNCDVPIATGNTPPTVEAGINYTVPRNTPFSITAVGSDPDGDPITYCWEQRDLGAAQALSAADNGTSPIVRSWAPTTNPTRTIPRLSNLLNNTLPIGEKYPAVNRTMDFRVTVRDNRAGGGGVNVDNMIVTINAASGPFQVTFPNTAMTVSGAITATWSVANTNVAPVNVTTVDILLSTDGGNTFPTVLLAGTPNDGSELVQLPNINTSLARIKVQGSGNIFFDISNANFTITSCPSSVAPGPEPAAVTKNRYISLKPDSTATSAALRVKMTSLPAPFTGFIGQSRWVGPPQPYEEGATPGTTFMASALQCTPHVRDWSTVGLLHVFGAEIVPDAEYEIQATACDPGSESGFSAPLIVRTARWGDVAEPFNPPSPSIQPDIADVAAIVDKFKDVSGALIKARSQLHPSVPDPAALIDFVDISSAVDAFKGVAYPYGGPSSCP